MQRENSQNRQNSQHRQISFDQSQLQRVQQINEMVETTDHMEQPFQKTFRKSMSRGANASQPRVMQQQQQQQQQYIQQQPIMRETINYQAIKPETDKNFQPRMDPIMTEDTIIRQSTLHVYGVDYMSQDDVMNYFLNFSPVKVEWLNDSSCNIVLATNECAKEAFQKLRLLQTPVGNDPLAWQDGKSYMKDDTHLKIQFRFATNKDVKPVSVVGKNSLFYRYSKQSQYKQRKEEEKRISQPFGLNPKHFSKRTNIHFSKPVEKMPFNVPAIKRNNRRNMNNMNTEDGGSQMLNLNAPVNSGWKKARNMRNEGDSAAFRPHIFKVDNQVIAKRQFANNLTSIANSTDATSSFKKDIVIKKTTCMRKNVQPGGFFANGDVMVKDDYAQMCQEVENVPLEQSQA